MIGLIGATIVVMAEKSRPRPPAGLGADSKRLWRDVQAQFTLDAHEVQVLRTACTIADVVGHLSAKLAAAPSVLSEPAVARELRLKAATLGRLLAALRLPVSDEAGETGPRPQYRGTRGFYPQVVS